MTQFENVKISVILPASGSGVRFGSSPPKQFCKLLDTPLLLHTVSCFNRCQWISDIVVTVSQQFKQFTEELVTSHGFHKVKVIAGCQHRHRSIYEGVKYLKESQPSVVIIHDAVRLFAEESLIREVAEAALKYGASGVVRPLVSTVIAPDSDGLLLESLDRSKYRASEMPQGFLYSVINNAYEQASDYDLEFGTECLLIAKKYTGTRAKLIDGPDYLWKVTYQKDLNAAENLLKENLLKVKVNCESPITLKNAIIAKCEERNLTVLSDEQADQECNTYVYVNERIDENYISESNTKAVTTNSNISGIHIARLVIHVYKGPKLAQEEKMQYIDLCRKLANENGDALVYGVLAENKDQTSDEQLSTIIVDTLWKRTKYLSGQTFIIN